MIRKALNPKLKYYPIPKEKKAERFYFCNECKTYAAKSDVSYLRESFDFAQDGLKDGERSRTINPL
jgi:hypothetical protein